MRIFGHHHHRFARQGQEHGHDYERSHHGRGGLRRGGGRGGRFFDQGDLRLVILALLAQQPRHGYEIIKEIEDRLGGAYVPSPGVVYPTLTLLEELGYASLTQDVGPKKLYAATPEGLAHLEQNKAAVDALFARIDQAGSGRDFAPRIMRAMGNVKLALRLRLSQGPLTSEQVDKIAAALDAAALEIERS
ncbi:MAG: PadR family transcriptional regulator [Caulobacteraceae bacterium]|jgi:DNA-binding PadR family transcriptional regulator|nr:PadR family transcriptional regulator [Caulobacteraceae bacterium]